MLLVAFIEPLLRSMSCTGDEAFQQYGLYLFMQANLLLCSMLNLRCIKL